MQVKPVAIKLKYKLLLNEVVEKLSRKIMQIKDKCYWESKE
jgi:hypothetical protein